MRKQLEMADAKTQDTKKALLSAQNEINELRLKLKSQEKEKVTASELSQVKKAATIAEAAKRELEQKATELEKTLQAEKKKRETAEAKAKDESLQVEALSKELKTTQKTVSNLEKERDNLAGQLAQASSATSQVNMEASNRLAALQAEVNHSSDLLRVCAEAYGSMSVETVPKSQLEVERTRRTEASSRLVKLERRLADKDAQFLELVTYIRHKDEQMTLLQQTLDDSKEELIFLRSSLQSNGQRDDQSSFDQSLLLEDVISAPLAQSDAQLASVMEAYYQEWIRTLLDEYKTAGHVASSLEGVLGKVLEQTASLDGQLQVAQVESEAARKRAREADELAGALENTTKELQEEKDRILQQLTAEKASLEEEVNEAKRKVDESRKRAERLDLVVKEKMAAEKALSDEVERLAPYSPSLSKVS